MRWVPPTGWWPRLVAWGCRHRVPGANSYAGLKIREEREMDEMGAVLRACLGTGKAVHARLNDAGLLDIEILGEEE